MKSLISGILALFAAILLLLSVYQGELGPEFWFGAWALGALGMAFLWHAQRGRA